MKDRRENDNIKLVHIHLRGGCEGPKGHTPVTVVGGLGSVTTDEASKRSPFRPYKMDKVERQNREITED